MRLYRIDTTHGIGIRAAASESAARREAFREVGEYNVESVTEATDKDVHYVRSMDGYVPRLPIGQSKEGV